MPRLWSAQVSGQGGFQVATRPAPWLVSVCVPVSKASLGPRPWPTHDGRSSISTASPSGHPSPASGHRRNGLFVLPAPCRSLGRGLEEMAIFAWAGGWTAEVCRAPRAGPGWDMTGPQLGKAPHRCPRPCPALCLSLPSGISVNDPGIFPQQLSPARSFTPAPCHWVEWAQVSAATRWEVSLSEIQDA